MSDVIISVRNLRVAFKDEAILEDVSFNIRQGRIYAIIGPNGCGKTTLIHAMSRNIRPTGGEVLLAGKDINRTNTKQVARKLAILSQSNAALCDVTVETLVHYGRFAHKQWWQSQGEGDSEIVDWALDRTGMTVLRGRKIGTLSGGERQRAYLAMAIAQKPSILLLDEPTTYLDIAHQLEIMELVDSLNKNDGITVVMVLHDINHAVRYSDELLILRDKTVWRRGEPWQLMRDGALEEAFNVEADILRDCETSKPVFYAKRVNRK